MRFIVLVKKKILKKELNYVKQSGTFLFYKLMVFHLL